MLHSRCRFCRNRGKPAFRCWEERTLAPSRTTFALELDLNWNNVKLFAWINPRQIKLQLPRLLSMPRTMAEVLHLMVDNLRDIRVETRLHWAFSLSARGPLGKVAVTGEDADTEPNEPILNTDCTAPRADLLMLQPAPPPPPGAGGVGGGRAAGAAAAAGTIEQRLSVAVVASTPSSACWEGLLLPCEDAVRNGSGSGLAR